MRAQRADKLIIFDCPGCEFSHAINDTWTFNGDFERPTITPSILVRGTVPVPDAQVQLIMAGTKVEPTPLQCHSFVTNGQIQFLSDCTHKLAGQTVDLPEL